MKRFEHEVLTFTLGTTKDFVAMQESLREWGHAGYEIVSVIQQMAAWNDVTGYTVFLKREIIEIQAA